MRILTATAGAYVLCGKLESGNYGYQPRYLHDIAIMRNNCNLIPIFPDSDFAVELPTERVVDFKLPLK